jgi:phosphoribosyl 1,2-cyclic phosphodiesterase
MTFLLLAQALFPIFIVMKLFVTALNSGSNGNCYYVGNDKEAVLIDAGISCRETERRMKRLELSMNKVKAIFISHEHSDHVRGAYQLSKKYKLPIYITRATLENSPWDPENPYNIKLIPYEPVSIGNLMITAFPKFHDAVDPHSFIVKYKDICVGVFTDIGTPCEHVIRNFKSCHAVFLETNYDVKMLAEGSYPYYLKKRISSDQGHLSNEQALELFRLHKPEFMSHIFLSHISKENNDPALVHELFSRNADEVEVVLTSRLNEIPVYEIYAEKSMKVLSSGNAHKVHGTLSLFN